MVESASLLKKCRSNPTKGSNPLLSATCETTNSRAISTLLFESQRFEPLVSKTRFDSQRSEEVASAARDNPLLSAILRFLKESYERQAIFKSERKRKMPFVALAEKGPSPAL